MTETNLRSADRLLVLEPIEGLTPKSTAGAPDARLFSGEQNIRLKMDPQTCLWYFQYSNNGILPGGLKGRFTGAKAAIKHAENYFHARNVRVSAIKD